MEKTSGIRPVAGLLFFAVAGISPAFAESEGLPQLDTSMFPEQLFWLAVCFLILYVLMSGAAMPRIARTQEKRERVIATELQAAHAANDTAKKTVAQVEKSLSDARVRAQASMASTLATMNGENAESAAQQERELARHLHRVESDIAVVRESAMHNVRSAIPDLARTVVETILHGKANA